MFMIGMTGNYVYSDPWGWDDGSSKELRNVLPFEFTRRFSWDGSGTAECGVFG
jgi:hypothetical protein